MKQQSIHVVAPSLSSQFTQHISLLSSRSDAQRRESLSYITSNITVRPENMSLQQPLGVIFPRLLPLILDRSNSVRAQLLKFLRALPSDEVDGHIEKLLLYIRAGMTHLAAEIRISGLDLLEWALSVNGEEVVTCPGGWAKTLKCLFVMLGWPLKPSTGAWTSGRSSFGIAGTQEKELVKILRTLTSFLQAGFISYINERYELSRWKHFPLYDVERNLLPKRSSTFKHLNLFGPPRDEDDEMYEDLEERQALFHRKFRVAIYKGLEPMKKAGGEIGRAAAGVKKVLTDGMNDYEDES